MSWTWRSKSKKSNADNLRQRLSVGYCFSIIASQRDKRASLRDKWFLSSHCFQKHGWALPGGLGAVWKPWVTDGQTDGRFAAQTDARVALGTPPPQTKDAERLQRRQEKENKTLEASLNRYKFAICATDLLRLVSFSRPDVWIGSWKESADDKRGKICLPALAIKILSWALVAVAVGVFP